MSAGFAFPLNVYARLLELRDGCADHLHYGLFEGPDERGGAAQQRATELLWRHLPGPCRLLEVGVGVGTTLARLRAAGYDAVGITPDGGQVEVARARHGDRIDVRQSRLEDFRDDEGRWQALLFQESAQYIDAIDLFDAADRLLNDGPSTLVVMDEFALRRSAPEHHGLHTLSSFRALAERRGWRITAQHDLSEAARPTVDYLLAGIRAEAPRLAAECGVSQAQLADLSEALDRYRRNYASGAFGYALLRLERDGTPPDRLRRVGPGEAKDMRALFARIFGQEMTPEHWLWKYGEDRAYAVGLWRDGEMVAHYAGITRWVLLDGQRVRTCQIGDVMVDPRSREGLTRRGPMAQVAQGFIETQVGWGARYPFGFGFPNDRAFRVAERLGLYTPVDHVVRARWPAAATPPAHAVEVLAPADLAVGGRRRAAADALWRQMAAALSASVIGIRDADWLQRRFVERPGVRYEISCLRRRWTRRPIGLVVYRMHEHHIDVLDLVAPPESFAALIAHVRHRAAQEGLAHVDCWITASHQQLVETIDAERCSIEPMNITVPANTHVDGPRDELRARWFLLAGDADFT